MKHTLLTANMCVNYTECTWVSNSIVIVLNWCHLKYHSPGCMLQLEITWSFVYIQGYINKFSLNWVICSKLSSTLNVFQSVHHCSIPDISTVFPSSMKFLILHIFVDSSFRPNCVNKDFIKWSQLKNLGTSIACVGHWITWPQMLDNIFDFSLAITFSIYYQC